MHKQLFESTTCDIFVCKELMLNTKYNAPHGMMRVLWMKRCWKICILSQLIEFVSIYLSIYLSVYQLSIYLSNCLFFYVFVCLYTNLTYLSIYLPGMWISFNELREEVRNYIGPRALASKTKRYWITYITFLYIQFKFETISIS